MEFLRVGWTVIRMHKFRSALTLLSIAIGTFSIVLMASLASSATATIAQGLEDLGGARMIMFFPKQPEKAEKKRASYSRGLTVDDADALRGRIPYVRYFEVHRGMGDREVSDASQQGLAGAPPVRKSADLVAANQDFFGAFGMNIAAGRALHPTTWWAGGGWRCWATAWPRRCSPPPRRRWAGWCGPGPTASG